MIQKINQCCVFVFVAMGLILLLSSLMKKEMMMKYVKYDQKANECPTLEPFLKSDKLFPETGKLFSESGKSAVSYNPFDPVKMTQSRDPSYNYMKVLQELNEDKAAMDDPRLIHIIRNYFIDPPSREEYNLNHPNQLEYSEGQTPFVDSRLNYMEGGFYVECGGLDGETRSNTLFLEKVRKWNGLLIEADPLNYEKLRAKNRKAMSINACISLYPYPNKILFQQQRNLGRVKVHGERLEKMGNSFSRGHGLVEIQCFPLYSMLLALNRTTLDYFSLDVEGDEFAVLKTIPFDKVNIKMLSVEYEHHKNNEMKIYMREQGYDLLLEIYKETLTANDWIFRKRGLSHTSVNVIV